MKLKIISLTIFIFAVLMAGGTYLYKISLDKKISEAQKALLARDYAPSYGGEEAKVVVVEFFDAACGTCAQFFPLVKDLVKKYDGKLKVLYRYAPLHENSDFISALLEAVRMQGKFEEVLSLLFENQNLWVTNHVSQPELAISLLRSADVNIDKALADMESEDVLQRIEQDISDMRTLGVNKTPSFFVNGKPLEKFGYNELVKLIESQIKEAYQ
jgi:protein-disulfide isomerase